MVDVEDKHKHHKKSHHHHKVSEFGVRNVKPTNFEQKSRRDESVSKESEDKDMRDVNQSGSDNSEDEEDDDEYDDEDEESVSSFCQSNDLQMASFIAPDDEVERELLEADEGDDKEERRQKKKKRKRSFRLEEDDYDLIKDNTGLEVKKRKRLLKHSEKEQNATDAPEESKAQSKLVKREDLGGDEDMEDDRETIKTERRKDAVLKDRDSYNAERRRVAQPVDYRTVESLDNDKVSAAKKIFEDKQSLAEEINLRQKQLSTREGHGIHHEGLEELFDGDEIDDQFATKEDKKIADRDIPERLQVKLGE